MRNPVLILQEHDADPERREAYLAAIRQAERAEAYLAAIAYMDLDDPAGRREVDRIRAEVEGLRRHLVDQRARLSM